MLDLKYLDDGSLAHSCLYRLVWYFHALPILTSGKWLN